MSVFRAIGIPLIMLVVAVTPALVGNNHLTTSSPLTAYAATLTSHALGERAVGASNQNEEDQKNKNGNNNNANDNNANGNDNNSNANDNNTNSNNNNGNDNRRDDTPPPPRQAAPPPAPVCSTPGQEMTFMSGDGRVSVRVFPSMAQSVKISIQMPVDSATLPTAPGQVVDGLLFRVIAENCNGGSMSVLPSEANLGVHYSDASAAGLNESSFTLAHLDTGANQWRQVQKQANDPPANFVSATITEMGYYVLSPRS